jgi:hypothetical protein
MRIHPIIASNDAANLTEHENTYNLLFFENLALTISCTKPFNYWYYLNLICFFILSEVFDGAKCVPALPGHCYNPPQTPLCPQSQSLRLQQ